MARQTYYVTRDMKHPLYRGRMLVAGDALTLSQSGAGLYRKLGVDMSETVPQKAAPKISAEEKTSVQEPVARTIAEPEAPKPKAKATPKAKRTTRRKK